MTFSLILHRISRILNFIQRRITNTVYQKTPPVASTAASGVVHSNHFSAAGTDVRILRTPPAAVDALFSGKPPHYGSKTGQQQMGSNHSRTRHRNRNGYQRKFRGSTVDVTTQERIQKLQIDKKNDQCDSRHTNGDFFISLTSLSALTSHGSA